MSYQDPPRYYLFERGQAIRCPCDAQVYEETGICSRCGPRYCPQEEHHFLISHFTNWKCPACVAYQDASHFRQSVRDMEKSLKDLSDKLEKSVGTISDKVERLDKKIQTISGRMVELEEKVQRISDQVEP